MWKQDLQAMLNIWPADRLIAEIKAVYGGILVKDTSRNAYMFNHNTGELKALSNEWRPSRKEAQA